MAAASPNMSALHTAVAAANTRSSALGDRTAVSQQSGMLMRTARPMPSALHTACSRRSSDGMHTALPVASTASSCMRTARPAPSAADSAFTAVPATSVYSAAEQRSLAITNDELNRHECHLADGMPEWAFTQHGPQGTVWLESMSEYEPGVPLEQEYIALGPGAVVPVQHAHAPRAHKAESVHSEYYEMPEGAVEAGRVPSDLLMDAGRKARLQQHAISMANNQARRNAAASYNQAQQAKYAGVPAHGCATAIAPQQRQRSVSASRGVAAAGGAAQQSESGMKRYALSRNEQNELARMKYSKQLPVQMASAVPSEYLEENMRQVVILPSA